MRKTEQLTVRWPLCSCVECGCICYEAGPSRDRHLRDLTPEYKNAVYTILGPEVAFRQGFGARDDGGKHLCPVATMVRVPDDRYDLATETIDPSNWEDL